jgi:ATP-dependent DNA helicase DinG
MHRANGYRPLLADYRALVVDEAHKLPEAASQMYGRSIGKEDVQEISYFLSREHKGSEGKRLQEWFAALQEEIRKHRKDGIEDMAGKESFYFPLGAGSLLAQTKERLQLMIRRLAGNIPYWIFRRLEEMDELFGWFLKNDKRYILFLQQDSRGHLTFMAVNREIPKYLDATLWSRGFPAILTSGTLKAGNGFARTRQMTGLEKETGVRECVAESPFCYKENCLLYIPENLKPMKKGSREEAEQLAGQIRDLVCSTYGHTLVLFTSYTLMGSVQQLLRDQIPFQMVQVWRNSQEEIARFKKMENAVLFAAGSCWEGVDFPGDMVSSLIIVKLPFSVPDPIHEAQREQYRSLESYIQTIVVPDMQKKLRQGFGRAIRTEQDTCVVSILDHRASKKGRYRGDVLDALPKCQMAERIEEVEDFIRSRKVERYYS